MYRLTKTLIASTFVALLCVPAVASAVGGISGSKLATPCTATVPAGKLELEPYLGINRSTSYFDGDFAVADTDRRDRTVETGFRFTAGLRDDLEVGLMVPMLSSRTWHDDSDDKLSATGLGDIPVGVKWLFWEQGNHHLALAAGVTIPTGDDEPAAGELALGDGALGNEVGVISTWDDLGGFSLDVHLGVGLPITTDGKVETSSGALDVALGYPIGGFQPIIELNQSVSGLTDLSSYELAATAGFTHELSSSVIIVSGVQVDLLGRDESRELTYSLAFTCLL